MGMCKAIMKQRQQQKVVIIQFANIESPVNELPSSMNRVSTVVARVSEICSCIESLISCLQISYAKC